MPAISQLPWPFNILTRNQETIMAAIDDLKASNTAIVAAVTGAITEIQTLASKLGGNADDADVEAVAQSLQTLATNLNNAVSAATPPAPAPAGS
jgi:hypothetical protein